MVLAHIMIYMWLKYEEFASDITSLMDLIRQRKHNFDFSNVSRSGSIYVKDDCSSDVKKL